LFFSNSRRDIQIFHPKLFFLFFVSLMTANATTNWLSLDTDFEINCLILLRHTR
jgi:hypothetical protein